MEIEIKKSVLSLAFIALLMVLPPPPAWPTCAATASSLLKTNNNVTTNIRCNGFKDECFATHEYIDLEFMMGSEIARMLNSKDASTGNSKERDKAAKCDRSKPGEPYLKCYPNGNPKSKPDCRGAYSRDCHLK
ncbi:hypothetical protein I3843_04G047200 [Carya illinoinensis]|nr:hypothetical protein I3843_04G047200 [Carya illinoinensis]